MPVIDKHVSPECGGLCLKLVRSGCPAADAVDRLPTCDALLDAAPGAMCEGDGECGTSRVANNCNGNQDVYERCASAWEPPRPPPGAPAAPPPPATPPPPPQPPVAPLPRCAADAARFRCDAGASCGLCLRPALAAECPPDADALPTCGAARPGALCEADGECGTLKVLNNCGGWRDVYLREACAASLDDAAFALPPADAQPAAAAVGAAAAAILLVVGAAAAVLLLRRRRRQSAAPTAAAATRTSAPAPGPKTEALVAREPL